MAYGWWNYVEHPIRILYLLLLILIYVNTKWSRENENMGLWVINGPMTL